MLSKAIFKKSKPKVEYSLTELGLKTLPVVDKLAEFGLENLV